MAFAHVSCSEDQIVSSRKPEVVLNVDSLDVHIVRDLHPDTGLPAGNVEWNIFYKLEGSTGAIFKVGLYMSTPGEYTFSIENPSIYRFPPLSMNTPLELHWDRWIRHDYSDMDSISAYISIEAHFWKEIVSPDGGIKQLDRGVDRWFAVRKIDIRNRDEM
jgi:hypothetical protein